MGAGYTSIHTGAEIDEAVRRVLAGEVGVGGGGQVSGPKQTQTGTFLTIPKLSDDNHRVEILSDIVEGDKVHVTTKNMFQITDGAHTSNGLRYSPNADDGSLDINGTILGYSFWEYPIFLPAGTYYMVMQGKFGGICSLREYTDKKWITNAGPNSWFTIERPASYIRFHYDYPVTNEEIHDNFYPGVYLQKVGEFSKATHHIIESREGAGLIAWDDMKYIYSENGNELTISYYVNSNSGSVGSNSELEGIVSELEEKVEALEQRVPVILSVVEFNQMKTDMMNDPCTYVLV